MQNITNGASQRFIEAIVVTIVVIDSHLVTQEYKAKFNLVEVSVNVKKFY